MRSAKARLNYRRLAATLTAVVGTALVCAVGLGRGTTAIPSTKPAAAAKPAPTAQELGQGFTQKMGPFLQTYCVECHSGADAVGDLNLEMEDWHGMEARSGKILKLVAKLSSGQMPPATSEHQPKKDERDAAVAWLKGFVAEQNVAHAGDPGTVLAHRLSNAEYNYTIHDLTGVDIAPAKEFPIDPANQAGFDNSGESLMMDPELTKKYLEAALDVSQYLVFRSDGLAFAPYTVIADTDHDKYAVNRIMDFYKRQPTDVASYLLAAWHYDQKKSAGKTLEAVAADEKVSAKYLKVVYEALTAGKEQAGPLAGLTAWWRGSLKDAHTPDAERQQTSNMAEWIRQLRAATRPTFPNLSAPGMDRGSQPFPVWKVRQLAATHFGYQAGSALKLADKFYIKDTPGGKAMTLPAQGADTAAYEKSFERFAAVFPDDYEVTERAPVYLDPNSGEGKLKGHFLNPGLHSQTGYFRDDQPLYDLILSDKDKKELDGLWVDLEMMTDAPLRQLQSMIWFERTDSKSMVGADFNFIRAEDTDLGQPAKLTRFRDTFLKDLNARTTPQTRQAIVDYFDYMQQRFKTLAINKTAAESKQLDSLIDLAAKAYRRPVTAAEKADLLAFYQKLRKEQDLDHEEAVRDVLVSVLMSPNFTYHYVAQPAGETAEALNDYELASRLSYFLWSSMPDAELLAHAAKGDLHDPKVLLAQAHRMIKDDRLVNFVTEFGGNWLDFRQFETHNGVDRERFPTFDNNLREAMFQEPIHFLTHLVRDDAPVLDALYGDYTFVNAALAKHYGMKVKVDDGDQWVRVDGAGAYERGGILPMAVFLTKNAPGLRTSPVKRGYWVVKRVLGEEIPAPPPNVPALPPDESKLELPLPQTLARHRADANCATCHVRFDSMGLVFEGYGPIGEVRKLDMAGKPVENTADFPTGGSGTGLAGLRKYVKAYREGDFLDNLCRKLLADALERTLILSDEALVAQMRDNLEKNNYRFAAMVDTIVTSPQFLTKRKRDDTLAAKP